MKIQFKQSFVEDEKEFKIHKKGKAELAEVPAYFLFLATFFNLLKSGLISILEVKEAELDVLDEKYKKQAEALSEDDQEFLESVLKAAEVKESSEQEGEDDGQESNSADDSSDASQSSNSGSAPDDAEVKEEKKQEDEQAKEDLDELKKERAALIDKTKRLTNAEKKRLAEIEEKLKG